ncbi:MAG: molybdopterin-dependent oxidoreductase [Acidobacteriota bacterium]
MADDGPRYNLIGKRIPMVDSWRKVTGQGPYTDDIKLPGMLVGKILRSPHPHARIARIDVEAARALPGVHAVVTGRDATNKFGVLPISRDETAMAVEKVKYIGDCVAGVAAEDEEIALEALRRIEVEYDVLPAVLTIDEALRPTDDPIHPHGKNGTNIHKQVQQEFGDVGEALGSAAHVASDRFHFIGVTHAFTEPHVCIAHYTAEGRLTVWSAQQVPHYLHRALAEVMGMDMHRVRVIRPMVGGGFGGKSDPFPHEMICALLSRASGRPVKILFDREEVFLTNHGRHPTRTEMAIATDEDGTITALDIDAKIDGGAWGSFGVVTTYYNGVLSVGPYRIPRFRYRGTRVYTNKPPCGAMRGHGAVNSRFAMETLVDRLAESCKLDPLEFRLRNLMPANTTTVNEFRITSNGTRECLERVRERSRWDELRGKMPYGEGIGVACGFYISGSAHRIHRNRFPHSTVHVKIDMDGGVTVHNLAAEIGQGSDTMLAQCVAEPIGVNLDRVHVYARNTDTAPFDLGSYSSRVTFMAGNAARRAGEAVAATLAAAASRLTGKPAEGFVFRDEVAIYAPEPEVKVPFLEALHEALAGSGALTASGAYHEPPPMGGSFKGAAAGLSPTYSFQAYVARVKVDPETGFTRVVKVWAAHDCGRALNPLAVEGQIEGCIHMGLGQALLEEFPYMRGNILNPNLLDYRTLTPTQMPEVEVILVESNDPEGPFGAKECGEGPLLPILPAVANAVYDAVGVRMTSLPMTPDNVLAQIERLRAADRRPQPAHA